MLSHPPPTGEALNIFDTQQEPDEGSLQQIFRAQKDPSFAALQNQFLQPSGHLLPAMQPDQLQEKQAVNAQFPFPHSPKTTLQAHHNQYSGTATIQGPNAHMQQSRQPLLPSTPEGAEDATVTIASTLHNFSRRLLSPQPALGPKIGFTPTPAMVKTHEDMQRVERPLFQFQVTKLRSWRTGYVRLLALYENRFCTIDPDTHQVTNTWHYETLSEWLALPNDNNTILLQVNADKLKFKCHNVNSPTVLSAVIECKMKFEGTADKEHPVFRTCSRQSRHGTRVSVSLQVAPHGLCEKHPLSLQEIQLYPYRSLIAFSFTADDNEGIVLHFESGKSRLFFIQSSRRHGNGRSDLVTVMRDCYEILGLTLQIRESYSTQSWLEQRRAIARDQTIVMIWDVTKVTKRHDVSIVGNEFGWVGGSVNRKLAVTAKGCLLELDGDGVVSCRPLHTLHALVRHAFTDKLSLEFIGGVQRTYGSLSRDTLLVSIFDAATTIGKSKTVYLSDVSTRGYTWTSPSLEEPNSFFHPISIPLYCLKRVHQVSTSAFAFLDRITVPSVRDGKVMQICEECSIVVEACHEFNTNVLSSGEGLPKGSSEKIVVGCVGALWGIISKLLKRDGNDTRQRYLAEVTATPLLQTLFRLTQTAVAYRESVELATFQASLSLFWGIDDEFCKFCVLRVISLLLSSQAIRDMEVEFVNKCIILRIGGQDLIDGLVSTMFDTNERSDGKKIVSDLILMVTSDILQNVLCSSHDTTSPEYFSAFIDSLAKGYRALLSALRSQTPYVVENTALLLHLLSSNAPTAAAAIRDTALSSGILLLHFHAAIFSPLDSQRFLSQYLCSLWLSGPITCDEKRLLKRMVPSGFLSYLSMPILSKREEKQLDELERDGVQNGKNINGETRNQKGDASNSSTSIDLNSQPGSSGTNTSRLRSKIAIATEKCMQQQQVKPENFRIFFHVITKDHSLPDLIWNQQTRQELRISLESELQSIKRENDLRCGDDRIAWNHQQFCVLYPSLNDEVKVGNVYMRLWLQAGDGFIKSWDEPTRLFEILFRRLLCELDRNTNVAVMCIRCLERLYTFHADRIGAWPDVMILLRSMSSTKNMETQHRLLRLVSALLGVSSDDESQGKICFPDNAEQLLNLDSIGQLCQFVSWGHTNGVQVGNLMSSTLRRKKPIGPLLTEGSEKAHESISSCYKPPEPNAKDIDPDCPAVWFVASTTRNPPPADKIRGPFRISQLKTMVQNRDLSPFDQVTSSLVEDYTNDNGTGPYEVTEKQIDTGKWHRLDHIWQLRWQLCTDEKADGVFSPSVVALLALRALARLVDLHKSLDSSGIPYFPVPVAKRLLCGLSHEPFQSGNGSENITRRGSYLGMLSQSLLCNDYRVVEASAQLLQKLLEHNEAAKTKFYLTGVYFFACCYTGSNFTSLARLFYETHLQQHFRSGSLAAADPSELPMKDRSVLGNMLPEGIILVLMNYGVDRFTDVFVGNFDTPEVIWNFEMRQHLIEMISQHLGDFPSRLWQNTTSEYEYCPLPGIAYKRLDKEVFCHNYYLNNLCDEAKFPNWPIAEPVEVFRACLEEWKQQMNRNKHKEVDALEEARKILDIHHGDDGKELRKAYRMLARKFHPDKNPAGREMFEKIQTSYELLLPLIASGAQIKENLSVSARNEEIDDELMSPATVGVGSSQMQVVLLLLKTQLLICTRYPQEMGKYKYPAYRLLLFCLHLPKSCKHEDSDDIFMTDCLVQKDWAGFVKAALDLVIQTCLLSPLNVEELNAEGGVSVLCSLFNFFIEIDKRLFSKIDEPLVDLENLASHVEIMAIIRNLVRTIACLCAYDMGRSSILLTLDPANTFGRNWSMCVAGLHTNTEQSMFIKKFALEGVASMAKSSELQNLMVRSGIVWQMVRLLLGFDPSLEQVNNASDDQDDLCLSQATCNTHARLAARGLGMMCGMLKDPALISPKNSSLFGALSKLLTPSIARLLRNKRTGDLLQTLNTNTKSPTRIWNVAMRNELESFLFKIQRDREGQDFQTTDDELKAVHDTFEYVSLKEEVTIGGVYLRAFNGFQGDRKSIQEIPDLNIFAKQVLDVIASIMNRSLSNRVGWTCLAQFGGLHLETEYADWSSCNTTDAKFEMAIVTLQGLVFLDEVVDDIFCEAEGLVPPILLSMLELDGATVLDIGCNILSALSKTRTFANAVASQGSLWRLLGVLERSDEVNDIVKDNRPIIIATRKQKGWSILESLSSTPSIANQLVRSSAWLELLGIVAGYRYFSKSYESRLGAAKILSRLLWDPQTGTIAAFKLKLCLPVALAFILQGEGPDSFLKVFDNDFETPELIWDADMRCELRSYIGKHLDRILEQRGNGDYWMNEVELIPQGRVIYKRLNDELYVGGVYVRLFLDEPTFMLRDPTSFLERLLHRWTYEFETHIFTKKVPASESSAENRLVSAQQNKIELVTSASVYLCKVKEALCDKLSEWGYMAKAVSLLQSALALQLLGSPLLCVVRLLHVASNRMANVEALSVVGGLNGQNGFVDGIKLAIKNKLLHYDCAFMLEMLKKVYKVALGDLTTAPRLTYAAKPATRSPYTEENFQVPRVNLLNEGTQQPNQYMPAQNPTIQAMAPSPAPGPNPVNRGSRKPTFDDPLMAPSPVTAVPTLSRASNVHHGTVNRSHGTSAQAPRVEQVASQQNFIDQVPTAPQQISIQVNGTPSILQGSQPYPHLVLYDYQQQITTSCHTTGTSIPASSSATQSPIWGSPFNAPLQSQPGYQQEGEISTMRDQIILFNSQQVEPFASTRHIPQSYAQRSAQHSTRGSQVPLSSTSYVQPQVPQMIMTTSEVQSRQYTQHHVDTPQPHLFSPGYTVQHSPTPIQGTGIDARSTLDPEGEADQQTLSIDCSPGAAHGRVSLLQSALSCELAEFLVNEVLENMTLENVKDPASAKVHSIELLTMLTKDPGYGLKFQLVLNKIPAWQKYKFQDHSLFITGAEQRSDYFLTEGGRGQQPLGTGLISEN